MKQERLAIKLEAATLPGGSRTRIVCPFCKGGSTKEKSLSISRDGDDVFYYCFRANCSARGVIRSNSNGSLVVPATGTPAEVVPPIYPLDEEDFAFFRKKFELYDEEIVLLAAGKFSRKTYAYSVYNHMGYTVGYTDRSYAGRTTKAIMRPRKRAIHYSPSAWEDKSAAIYLVEDQVSAIKLGRHCPAVALLGTWLTPEEACALSYQTGTLHVCLDPDARVAALRLKRLYGMLFREVHIHTLAKDPKDMTDEELVAITHQPGAEHD